MKRVYTLYCSGDVFLTIDPKAVWVVDEGHSSSESNTIISGRCATLWSDGEDWILYPNSYEAPIRSGWDAVRTNEEQAVQWVAEGKLP